MSKDIKKKYETLAKSIEGFFKKKFLELDDYLQHSYSVESLMRLKLLIDKEILLSKNVLSNEELLKEKDSYIMEKLYDSPDMKASIELLYSYLDKKINEETFANKSIINDLLCSLEKNNLKEFLSLISRIEKDTQKPDFKYPFVKEFISDVVGIFNHQDNFKLFLESPSKYEKYNLGFNETDLLVEIREYSKLNNHDKKSYDTLLAEISEDKKKEEIVNILKTNRDKGFYTEVSFVSNGKPYLYIYDIATKSWNKDKQLIDDVLKSCENLILSKIVQSENIQDLKDFIIMNEKRDAFGQKYLNDEDYINAKKLTINNEIMEILDSPSKVIQECNQNKKQSAKQYS